jgi:hypothetical protein
MSNQPSFWLLRFRELTAAEKGRDACADSANSANSSTTQSNTDRRSTNPVPIGANDTIGTPPLASPVLHGKANARVESGTLTKALKESLFNRPTADSANSAKSSASHDGAFGEPDWLALYEERAAHREFDGGHTRPEAEKLAWSEMQNRWHAEHGERVPPHLCAGCRRPIGSAEVIDMIDGTRVHITDKDCLIRYGTHWRLAATRALIVLGLKPPDAR